MVSRKATMRSRSTATNRYDDIFALCLTLVNKPLPPSLPPNINRRKLFALPSDNISFFRLSISLDPLSILSLSLLYIFSPLHSFYGIATTGDDKFSTIIPVVLEGKMCENEISR